MPISMTRSLNSGPLTVFCPYDTAVAPMSLATRRVSYQQPG